MTHRVKDLSREQRLAIESLLSRPVSDDEAISIKGVPPAMAAARQLTSREREEALKRLTRYFAKIDAQRVPVSAGEEEAILDEALRSTRPHYRPVS